MDNMNCTAYLLQPCRTAQKHPLRKGKSALSFGNAFKVPVYELIRFC